MTTNSEPILDPAFFKRIKAQNLLSFGSEGIDLELKPLNVLIGPNGSGKSNLLEIFALLQAAPFQLARPVRHGGGASEWVWKGAPDYVASLSAELMPIDSLFPTHHSINFTVVNQMFWLCDERISAFNLTTKPTNRTLDVRLDQIYEFRDGEPTLKSLNPESVREIPSEEVKRDESILSQRKDSFNFPNLYLLDQMYRQIRLYRETQIGHGTVFRQPQSIDVVARPLEENYSNLWMFLSKLRQQPQTKAALIEKIADIYEGVTDFELNIEGGTVQLFLTEGNYTIPATRLSDGTLRYICLLAILLDPEPPAFIAIEEPELGMHPDLIPKIADLLIDASTRTQLVVTTHSEMLVEVFHDQPEAIVVCEKHDGQTRMNRLNRDELSIWLKDYRIGDLWMSGQLGGVRW